MFKTLVSRGWYPTLITAVAVVSLIFYDIVPFTVIVPALVILLFIGLAVTIIGARKNELERQSLRLAQLTTHFNRSFMGNSSVSIFAAIDGLFSVEDPKVWDWARACSMSQRIFDTWTDSFATRVESDLRGRRFTLFLHSHLNELWSINTHYFEFTEQFCEIVGRYQVPPDVIEQYNKFAVEYNVFVENFRDTITELRNIARTQIEAPSIRLARELPAIRR